MESQALSRLFQHPEENLSDMCSDVPWFAIQLRPNREEHVRSSLSSKGYDVILPTYEKKRSYRGISLAREPLYPGYLFCRLNPTATGKVVTTPGVIRIIGFGGSPQPVPPDEMEIVMRMASSELPVQPWAYLPVGTPVRIASGPLQGLTGTLTSRAKTRQLVVTLLFLQRSAAVTLDEETELISLSRPQTFGSPLVRAARAGS